jgi:anti-sigma-K factor RskA
MDVHELTAAYALDALDADEARAYEAHLAGCERCRAELAQLSEGAAHLAWGAESPAPPDRLRASILAQAAAERQNVAPLPVTRSRLFRATAAVAVVAACAAVALGVLAASRSGSKGSCAAGWRCSALAGGRGLVAIDPAGRGVLVVHQLTAAPSGKTYEAWVIPHGGAPRPAGLFHGGGATTIVRLRQPVPRGAVVATTIERSGGVQQPTQTPIFSAQA